MSMSYRKIYTSPGNNVRSELEQDALGRVLHVHARMHAKLLQSCPTLCNTMACSPPGSSAHRILQARILKQVAMPCSMIFQNQGLSLHHLMTPALTGGFYLIIYSFFLLLVSPGKPLRIHSLLQQNKGKAESELRIWKCIPVTGKESI